ncbi:hypothetical protein HGRIS_003241 [Hohenbuehelia grisea]|uniref:Uncharacterized protein n=1 Tax=Hohenbuehelia grisea TaxID=104357 RepID=A0ABR3JMV9_9AGAR
MPSRLDRKPSRPVRSSTSDDVDMGTDDPVGVQSHNERVGAGDSLRQRGADDSDGTSGDPAVGNEVAAGRTLIVGGETSEVAQLAQDDDILRVDQVSEDGSLLGLWTTTMYRSIRTRSPVRIRKG